MLKLHHVGMALGAVLILPSISHAGSALEQGRIALHKMAGCYLVDYSYVETDALKPGYIRDPRVYDVNKDKSVKEWIFAEDDSPSRVVLQHILFANDRAGKSVHMLKHQAEDWVFDAPYVYEFTAPNTWEVKLAQAGQMGGDQWTRKITNLDDGLRYQCSAAWDFSGEFPQWGCANFSPIPGRETRDMGRKDYNTLDRYSHLVLYGNSWLERQTNMKTIFKDGVKTPLVREEGKNWYVRLPDAECAAAQEFVKPRVAFWRFLRRVWDEVLDGSSAFIEQMPPRSPPRFVRMGEIEEKALGQNLMNPEVVHSLRGEILKVISDYRVSK